MQISPIKMQAMPMIRAGVPVMRFERVNGRPSAPNPFAPKPIAPIPIAMPMSPPTISQLLDDNECGPPRDHYDDNHRGPLQSMVRTADPTEEAENFFTGGNRDNRESGILPGMSSPLPPLPP